MEADVADADVLFMILSPSPLRYPVGAQVDAQSNKKNVFLFLAQKIPLL
ncbi:hypothetical protein ACFTAO_31815 [Paenibacillus rhizoplanae]